MFMSNVRIFFSESLSINFSSKLNKSQSHYLNKVMKIKENVIFLYLIKEENGKQKLIIFQKVLLSLMLQGNLDKKKI